MRTDNIVKGSNNCQRKLVLSSLFWFTVFPIYFSFLLKKKNWDLPLNDCYFVSKKILHFPWSLEKQGTNANKIRIADRFARVGKWNDRQFVTCCIEIRSPISLSRIVMISYSRRFILSFFFHKYWSFILKKFFFTITFLFRKKEKKNQFRFLFSRIV